MSKPRLLPIAIRSLVCLPFAAPLLAQQLFAELPRQHLPAAVGATAALAAIDIDGDGDGDGDLELFEGDEGRDRVLRNRLRQLRSRRLFSLGAVAELQGHAVATTPSLPAVAALFLGVPSGAVPTPFGAARLSLGGVVPVSFQVVPPAASVSWSIPVPNSAGLVGFVVGAQMLALHDAVDWRLTGLVVEVVR